MLCATDSAVRTAVSFCTGTVILSPYSYSYYEQGRRAEELKSAPCYGIIIVNREDQKLIVL